jgi:phosphate:Na+ symporter
MFTLLTIAGGVALILFGVRYLRKGLDRLFGSRLATGMQRLARSRARAFFTGLGVSVLAPSSTTMSVLAVQTVQAGHLTARQTLAILLGADIGLTVTVQLIAMNLHEYAPILILIGVGLFQFTKHARSRGIGQVVLAVGFMFLGVLTIKNAAATIQPTGDVTQLLDICSPRSPPWRFSRRPPPSR